MVEVVVVVVVVCCCYCWSCCTTTTTTVTTTITTTTCTIIATTTTTTTTTMTTTKTTGNQLHWYWQPKIKKQNNTCIWNIEKTNTKNCYNWDKHKSTRPWFSCLWWHLSDQEKQLQWAHSYNPKAHTLKQICPIFTSQLSLYISYEAMTFFSYFASLNAHSWPQKLHVNCNKQFTWSAWIIITWILNV